MSAQRSSVWLAKGQEVLPDPPYAHDVRAKGWLFSLDCERMYQSDTWVLTAPEVRPWLLITWVTSWTQTPCGSLPANDDLIAAHTGMPLRQFAAHRDLIMRGWYLASDGRLYHPYITSMVQTMLGRKAKDTERKSDWRRRKAAAEAAAEPVQPQAQAELAAQERTQTHPHADEMSRGTDTGQTRDRRVTDVGATTPIPIPIPIPTTTGKVVPFVKGGVGESFASLPEGSYGQDDGLAPASLTNPAPAPAPEPLPCHPEPITARPKRVSKAPPPANALEAQEAPFDAGDAAQAALLAQEAVCDKAHPLPIDWTLPKSWGLWAMDASEGMGWSRERTLAEAAKFRDHWRGKTTTKDGRKSDWKGTWRNWCRNAEQFAPRAFAAQGVPAKSVRTESRQEALERRNAEVARNFMEKQKAINGAGTAQGEL